MYKIKVIDNRYYVVREDGIIVKGYYMDWLKANQEKNRLVETANQE